MGDSIVIRSYTSAIAVVLPGMARVVILNKVIRIYARIVAAWRWVQVRDTWTAGQQRRSYAAGVLVEDFRFGRLRWYLPQRPESIRMGASIVTPGRRRRPERHPPRVGRRRRMGTHPRWCCCTTASSFHGWHWRWRPSSKRRGSLTVMETLTCQRSRRASPARLTRSVKGTQGWVLYSRLVIAGC